LWPTGHGSWQLLTSLLNRQFSGQKSARTYAAYRAGVFPPCPLPSCESGALPGTGSLFKGLKVAKGSLPARPAHLLRRTQAHAHGRTLRFSEERAAVVGQELHARDARGLSVWHAGNRRTDRRRDAARSTLRAALHRGIEDHSCLSFKLRPEKTDLRPAAGTAAD
jgi:hypothetical protein